MADGRQQRVHTAITHTINVVEKSRGYWSSSASTESIVTKYVIKVSLAAAEAVGAREPLEWQVARRYSHFRSNHAELSRMFSQLKLPRLPPKEMALRSPTTAPDPDTVASRMVLLDAYLRQLVAVPAIAGCTQMRTFLGAYHGMQAAWFSEVGSRSLRRSLTAPPNARALDGSGGGDGSSSRGNALSLSDDYGDDEVDDACDEYAALTFGRTRSAGPTVPAMPPIGHSTLSGPPPPLHTGIANGGGRSSANGAAPAADAAAATAGGGEEEGAGDGVDIRRARQRARGGFDHLPYTRADDDAATIVIAHLGLLSPVESFAAQFDQRAFLRAPEAASGTVQRLLNTMEAAIAVSETRPSQRSLVDFGNASFAGSSLSSGCTEQMLWCARDILEDRLLDALHDQVFGVLPEEAAQDAALHGTLASLAPLMRPEDLDVPAAFCDTRFNRWDATASELRLLPSRRTPREKMECVLQAVLQLKQGLVECLAATGGGGVLGADELFPVFVYVVLHANPPQLSSTLAYVQRFRSPMALKSEAGCYLTHLQAAAAFLSGLAAERDAAQLAAAQPAAEGGGGGAPEAGAPEAAAADVSDGGASLSSTESTLAAGGGASRATPPLTAGSAADADALGGGGLTRTASAGGRSSGDGGSCSGGDDESSEQPAARRTPPGGGGPRVSRQVLAQRRTLNVESAAQTWERQIETTLMAQPQPLEQAAGDGATTPTTTAAAPHATPSTSASPAKAVERVESSPSSACAPPPHNDL